MSETSIKKICFLTSVIINAEDNSNFDAKLTIKQEELSVASYTKNPEEEFSETSK